ncbi:hypothetical protein AB0P21_34115 [Kribbella sp. NPDC056861]|uniref:hypothetical protein n=1 Tax=Kribbella sp. NPDC056861 TaxID=3154857 RepID=UPI00342299CF
MLRPLATLAAATVLLAGCSGGDDKKSDSTPGDDTNTSSSSPTPTTPELPSFDPPKGFSIFTAVAEERPADGSIDPTGGKAGMVGKTTLYANKTGLNGVWIDGSQSWQVPAKEIESTKVIDYARPTAVQLDGKEAIAMAYVQNVEAGGTQKAHGQVVFQWIDPADGKVLSTVSTDLTSTVGPGTTGGSLTNQEYDPATGQFAVTLGTKASGNNLNSGFATAYADPATKKGLVIPTVEVAGVLNGTVVGAKGRSQENAKDLSIVAIDGATGAVKKNIPTPTTNYLSAESSGGKHAYLSGTSYVQDTKYTHHTDTTLYAVDFASLAVAETKLPKGEDGIGFGCLSDHVSSLICNYVTKAADGTEVKEIMGLDDATGKKSWGFSSASASRVVPTITTMYNGYAYGKAETLPAVLDAKTGQDVPAPAPPPGSTPSTSESPTPAGTTPTDDSGATPDGNPSPGRPAWGDPSLIFGEPLSPEAVSKYGSTYLLSAAGKAPGSERILVVQKAIG